MCSSEPPTPSQPSTTPGSSQPAGGTSVPCHPACSLTSQTVATSPSDRARTKLGVGEEVTLTVTGNPATWTISGGGTLSPSSGTHSSVTFTADDNAGSVTITAAGSGCSCSNPITFNVVRPANWTMKRKTGTNLKHSAGRPDCGWKGIVYLHPDDVNFYNLQICEEDSQAVATGSYSVFNGVWHGRYPPPDRLGPWIPIVSHSDADGSGYGGTDTVYSGDPQASRTGSAPPFTTGNMHFPITRKWRIGGTGTAHDFPVVRQEHEIFANGRCESNKAGNPEHTMHNDPPSTY